MLHFDSSISIVGTIAVVALLSPPVTSIIENIFKLIAKKMDRNREVYNNEHNHKRELFEDFLHCTGMVSYDRNEYIKKLLHAYYVLIPYIPAEKVEFFRLYCDLIQEDGDANNEYLSNLLHGEIVPCIKQELCRYKPLKQ